MIVSEKEGIEQLDALIHAGPEDETWTAYETQFLESIIDRDLAFCDLSIRQKAVVDAMYTRLIEADKT